MSLWIGSSVSSALTPMHRGDGTDYDDRSTNLGVTKDFPTSDDLYW